VGADDADDPTDYPGLFTLIGYEYRYARAHDESVYDVHARRAQTDLELQKQQRPIGPPPDQTSTRLEYPPLAAWVMSLPTYFAPPIPGDWYVDEEHMRTAGTAFRCMIAIVDAAVLVILIVMLQRLYPGRPGVRISALALYTIGGLALYHLLYDRFDLLAGCLILLALAILLGRSQRWGGSRRWRCWRWRFTSSWCRSCSRRSLCWARRRSQRFDRCARSSPPRRCARSCSLHSFC